VDELALEFDDGEVLTRQLIELGWLPAESADHVHSLGALLAAMSGKDRSELWSADALRESEEWSKVRRVARDLLFVMAP